ncbi:MAG: anthranilate/aminodeoxychorismate synthase component II [Chitinivibrionales bacterium]|nr:anthranilate/aminodeoxychorismate synthase component II [Chitinivibrionales bacterium]
MILVIDNYDSFTFNLVQYIGEIYADLEIFRNDQITPAEILAKKPRAIVISPGPCTPLQAGISVEVAGKAGPIIPTLGVCLGHQSIGYAFGGKFICAPYLMHGKVSQIKHCGEGMYAGLPNPFIATRYHSLIIERESLPDCLSITAETPDGIIMGLRHKQYPIEGIQFHPESILTEVGKQLLRNYIEQLP